MERNIHQAKGLNSTSRNQTENVSLRCYDKMHNFTKTETGNTKLECTIDGEQSASRNVNQTTHGNEQEADSGKEGNMIKRRIRPREAKNQRHVEMLHLTLAR